MRLVRGRRCNEESSREPDIFNRIEEGSGLGVIELDGVSKEQAAGAWELTSIVVLPILPPVAQMEGELVSEAVVVDEDEVILEAAVVELDHANIS